MFRVVLDKVRNGGEIEQRLTSGAVTALVFQITGIGLSFLLNILLARELGANGYGIYTFIITLTALGATLGRCGLDQVALRLLPEYTLRNKVPTTRGLVDLGCRVILVVSVAVGLITVIGLVAFRYGAEYPQTGILVLVVALVPVTAMFKVSQANLRGLGYLARALIVDYLIRPAGIIALVFALATITLVPFTPLTALLITLIVMLCGLFLQQAWIYRVLEKQAKGESGRSSEWSRWLSLAAPLWGGGLLTLILARADIIMLGFIRGGQDVGYYSAAARIATLVGFGLTILNIVVAPVISELYSAERSTDLERLLTLVIRAGGLFGLVTGVMVLLMSPWILRIFGPGFEAAKVPLAILVGGQIVNIAAGPVGLILAMTDRQNARFTILLIGAVLNVGIGLVGIHYYGITGAALGTALSMIFWNLAMVHYVYQHAGLLIVPMIGVFSRT